MCIPHGASIHAKAHNTNELHLPHELLTSVIAVAVADDFLDAEESDGDDGADPAAYSYDDLAAAFEGDDYSDDDGGGGTGAGSDGEEAQDEEAARGVLKS